MAGLKTFPISPASRHHRNGHEQIVWHMLNTAILIRHVKLWQIR
jgi:hypothetical protein